MTFIQTHQTNLMQRVLLLQELAKLQYLSGSLQCKATSEKIQKISKLSLKKGHQSLDALELQDQIKTSQYLTQHFSWHAIDIPKYTHLENMIKELTSYPDQLDFVITSLQASENIAKSWLELVHNILLATQQTKDCEANLDREFKNLETLLL